MYTSATHDTMERIPSFTAESGGVLVALGAKVRGNIQVIVHHIRAIPLARKANMVRECSPRSAPNYHFCSATAGLVVLGSQILCSSPLPSPSYSSSHFSFSSFLLPPLSSTPPSTHSQGMTAVRMFQFQFHTGFISPSTTTLVLDRYSACTCTHILHGSVHVHVHG